MDDRLYMSADEAAEALGVSVATVYAYVSRKMLRSHRPQGARASKYWRADVERLRGGAGGGREGDPLVSQTQITVITEEGPFYRGQSAITLAQTETAESVAALLWDADQSAIFPTEPPKTSDVISAYLPSLSELSPIDKAMAIFPIIERENPRAYDLTPAGFARTAGEVMRWFAAIMVGETPSAAPLHEVVTSKSKDSQVMAGIVRRLLVLSADHELDPTTYAVRAVANVGVSPYRLAIAGLITSTGRRLPYGRIDAVSRLLDEIETAVDPKGAIVSRLRDGEPLPGFGSRQYAKHDPRADSLLAALNADLSGDSSLTKLNAAIEVVREVTGLEPGFGLVNLFVGRRLGLRRQDGVALRLGRMTGWMAHAMEQYHGQEFVRPTAAYVGVLPSKATGNAPSPSDGLGAKGKQASAQA